MIDNLRYDQWKVLQPIIEQWFNIEEESTFYSILPTATQYSRNSIFSGLTPLDLSNRVPNYGNMIMKKVVKNLHEGAFLLDQMKRLGMTEKMVYHKIVKKQYGDKLVAQFQQFASKQFQCLSL